MSQDITRRKLLKDSVLASAGITLGLSLEEQTLLAKEQAGGGGAPPALPPAPKDTLPTGKLGDLNVSRLILGGNLIGGWAHSRDLVYVSQLLKHYFSDEKIIETMAVAESYGINTINTHPSALEVIKKYRKLGGKIQWMVQGLFEEGDHFDTMRQCIDAGAQAMYILGNISDSLVKQGKTDLMVKALDFIHDNNLSAGVAAHSLDVPMTCEKLGMKVDYYVKTFHSPNYWSTRRPEQTTDVLSNPNDNFWCANPKETADFMAKVERPWVAYKVLAAGAISPQDGFRFAFENGADFALVGMFDWQIAEDVRVAKEILSGLKRPPVAGVVVLQPRFIEGKDN